MKQRIDNTALFCLPSAQTILGTHLNGRVNFMALAWLTRVNIKPAMIGITMNRNNASYGAIRDTREFSINLPSTDLLAQTDYSGIVSGSRVDKSDLFEVFYGELKAAPMIRQCPLTLECSLYQEVELPSHSFLVAEIISIFTEEQFLTDQKPDMEKIRPFLLTMPDNRYWQVGESIDRAWHAGKPLLKK